MSAQSMAAQAKAGRRKKKHEEHEEHENHERWLITYADMITLLMVLFIVLFSIGQTDLEKFRQLQEGLAEGFGNEAGLVSGGPGLLTQTDASVAERLAAADEALAARADARAAIAADRAALEQTQEALDERLTSAGVRGDVDLRIERRGLIVTIVTDQVLFRPGSDAVLTDGRDVLGPVAGALAGLPNEISVEGHTDDVPISNGRFASNWELSTARATSVLRLIRESAGIEPGRLAAAGYADTRPIADNSTREGRAANRRVEIVVHSLVDEAALVADVAGADSPPTTIHAVVDPIPEASHGQEAEG